jgi:hypothetical protein
MNKAIVFIVLTCFAVWVKADTTVPGERFGAEMPEDGDVLTLMQAITALKSNTSEEARLVGKIEGQITEVCQKKGCFMVLVDRGLHARVTFKDYGFFVPKDAGTSTSVVYGELTIVERSTDEINHFARDVGRPAESIAPVKEYAIVASSVVIR